MNQGEIIQSIRLYERQLLIADERLTALEKKVHEMDEILKSPIRRDIYASKSQQSKRRLSSADAESGSCQTHDSGKS